MSHNHKLTTEEKNDSAAVTSGPPVLRSVASADLKSAQDVVTGLSPSDFTAFSEWFSEYHEQIWDKEIENDAAAGLLDELMDEALSDFKAGRCTPL